jgi:uncharacterized RDD family membrane protein YckC
MSIATPEGLVLDVVLAGAGSRFIAALLDTLLRLGILLAVLIAMGIGEAPNGFVGAVGIVLVFVLLFVYDVAFELAMGGQTPGKRWTGLRVTTTSGGAVGLGASLVRNLLRVVDFLPASYLVGIVLVAVTSKHQRVGDLVAGTIVVRERREELAPPPPVLFDGFATQELRAWDVSAVTAEEVLAARRFLERRATLDPQARMRLSVQIAERLRPKVVLPVEPPSAEKFLEDLVRVKTERS